MGVPARYYLVDFPTLGLQLPAEYDEASGKMHFPVASACAAIELDVRTQRPRLQREYAEHLSRRRLPTKGGPQEQLCIEYEALALWLATVQSSRVGERTRERVRYFRRQVMRAASDILEGKLQPVLLDERRSLPPATRGGESLLLQVEGRVSHLERAVFVGEPTEDDAGAEVRGARCPHCGGPIRITVGSLQVLPD